MRLHSLISNAGYHKVGAGASRPRESDKVMDAQPSSLLRGLSRSLASALELKIRLPQQSRADGTKDRSEVGAQTALRNASSLE